MYGAPCVFYRPSIPYDALGRFLRWPMVLDLSRAPYVLYAVKYIDLVSRMTHWADFCAGPSISNSNIAFKMAQSQDLGFVLISDPSTLGCWGQNMSRFQNEEVYATLLPMYMQAVLVVVGLIAHSRTRRCVLDLGRAPYVFVWG